MNDKQRAEFEKWFTSQIDSEYCSTNVKALLSECWQAAIASVVVVIPSFFSDRYETDIIYSDDMEKALEKAGIRYE